MDWKILMLGCFVVVLAMAGFSPSAMAQRDPGTYAILRRTRERSSANFLKVLRPLR